jgi:hypothetical protein
MAGYPIGSFSPGLVGFLAQVLPGLARHTADVVKTPYDVVSGKYNVEPEVPGQWSDTDEARLHANYNTMLNRGQDLAGLAMTGGIPIPKTPGMTLTSGISRPPPGPKDPPLVAAYHATPAKEEYTKFKKSDIDMGTHSSIDPEVAAPYAQSYLVQYPPPAGMTDPGFKPRTIPVLNDIRSSFRFPGDAMNWAIPDNVIGILENKARAGARLPRSMISDFENIAKQSGEWVENFPAAMKEKGFDSILYPHADYRKYNTIMAFDPEQVKFRWSPEGRALEQQRGVVEPFKRWWDSDRTTSWRMPRGILKPYDELSAPGEFKPMFKAADEKQMAQIGAEQERIKSLKTKLAEGKITPEQFQQGHYDIFGQRPLVPDAETIKYWKSVYVDKDPLEPKVGKWEKYEGPGGGWSFNQPGEVQGILGTNKKAIDFNAPTFAGGGKSWTEFQNHGDLWVGVNLPGGAKSYMSKEQAIQNNYIPPPNQSMWIDVIAKTKNADLMKAVDALHKDYQLGKISNSQMNDLIVKKKKEFGIP